MARDLWAVDAGTNTGCRKPAIGERPSNRRGDPVTGIRRIYPLEAAGAPGRSADGRANGCRRSRVRPLLSLMTPVPRRPATRSGRREHVAALPRRVRSIAAKRDGPPVLARADRRWREALYTCDGPRPFSPRRSHPCASRSPPRADWIQSRAARPRSSCRRRTARWARPGGKLADCQFPSYGRTRRRDKRGKVYVHPLPAKSHRPDGPYRRVTGRHDVYFPHCAPYYAVAERYRGQTSVSLAQHPPARRAGPDVPAAALEAISWRPNS